MKAFSSRASELTGGLRQQAYNVLDCCVPMEALPRLLTEADEDEMRAYRFDRALQGPAFTMAVRGIAVDEAACQPAVAALQAKEQRCVEILDRLAEAWEFDQQFPLSTAAKKPMKAWGVERFNPLSHQQTKQFLYAICSEKPYHNRKAKGTDTTTANDDALQDITIRSPLIGTIAATILRTRELRKARSFIEAPRSPDGKLRCSFNVGATKFGRWSSSQNCYKDGLNFFNLPHEARKILIPSRASRVMVNVDLKQAESCIVAHLAQDEAYIRAHQGDAHTSVAVDIFNCRPEEAKTRTGPAGMTLRNIAKRLGHGTNYGLGERHAARLAGLRVGKMRELRRLYFTKYKGIARRIEQMPARLRTDSRFLFASGRPHVFIGAHNDHETIKSALSGEPQGIVADLLNIALFRLWQKYDGHRIWLLNVNYDSILFEAETEGLEETLALVKAELKVPVLINGAAVELEHDLGVGRNWQEASS